MLKKKTPDTIPAMLNLKSQGEEFKLSLTYRNLKPAEYDEVVAKAKAEHADDLIKSNAAVALALIVDWVAEYELNMEGLIEANDDRPYLIAALIGGFFEARAVERVKN